MTVNENKHEQPVPSHCNLIFSFLLSLHNCFILLRYLAFYFKVIACKEALSKSCCLFHLYILLALCCSWNVSFNYRDSLSFERDCMILYSTTNTVLARINAVENPREYSNDWKWFGYSYQVMLVLVVLLVHVWPKMIEYGRLYGFLLGLESPVVLRCQPVGS